MAQEQSLQGRRILVVEDDYLVAEILVEILEEAGAEVIGPIGWVGEAMAFLRREGPMDGLVREAPALDGPTLDAAVLDVNLHGQRSYPIADSLAERGVPVVFVTGYGASALEEAYRHHPRCEKPFHSEAVLTALAGTQAIRSR